MPLRSDSILADIAALHVVDDARTRRYIQFLDDAMQRVLDRAGEKLPSAEWMETGDPRTVTEGAGYLAFFHAFPRSRHYRNPRLLAGFRAILEDVLAHQFDTGELTTSGEAGVERPQEFPPHPHISHGQSWYLEPLLFGMNWLRREFTAAERARIDHALYRTADFICGRPIHEMDNRGVIVCAILAMCGRYFREQRFIEEAVRNFHGVPIRVFDPRSGQILEGSGPDGNYSGTTYEYLYIYRLMSGDEDIDGKMIAALKWRARVHDPNGHQTFCGASTRIPVTDSIGGLRDILPALERYSPQEPFFQTMVEQYLPLVGHALGQPGHSITPAIWALLEHSDVKAPAQAPAWYSDMRSWYYNSRTGPEHFYYNEGYDSLYFPVRQAYTTCVAVRGRAPFKDLQCWTYASEPPVVYPAAIARPLASRTRTWGIDTSTQGASGIKIPNFCWVEGDVPALIVQWEELWRYYLFAPRTTFVLTAGKVGRCEVDWVVDTRVCGVPEAGETALTYPGRVGRLRFAAGKPEILTEGDVRTHRFSFPGAPFWFALTDDSFGMELFEKGCIRFRDGAGRYEALFTFSPELPNPKESLTGFPHESAHRLQIRRLS